MWEFLFYLYPPYQAMGEIRLPEAAKEQTEFKK
jgi:hypothetical protein